MYRHHDREDLIDHFDKANQDPTDTSPREDCLQQQNLRSRSPSIQHDDSSNTTIFEMPEPSEGSTPPPQVKVSNALSRSTLHEKRTQTDALQCPTLMENMTQTNTLCHPSLKEISTQTEAVRQPCLTENTSQTDMIYERPCHTTVVFYDHQVTSVAGWRAHAQPSTFSEQPAITSSADNETPRACQNKPYQPNLWSILRDEVANDRPCLVTEDNEYEELGQCQTKQQIKSKSDSEVLNPRLSTQRQLHEHHDSNTQDLLHSNCVQCSRPWSMTTTNATWYIEHEMQVPKRCIECRATRRNRTNKKMQRRTRIASQEVKITEHPHTPFNPWNKPVFPEPSRPSTNGDKPVEEEWPKLRGKF